MLYDRLNPDISTNHQGHPSPPPRVQSELHLCVQQTVRPTETLNDVAHR